MWLNALDVPSGISVELFSSVQSSMSWVVNQLEMLWSGDMVKCLFRDLVNLIPVNSGAEHSFGSGHKDLGAPVKG